MQFLKTLFWVIFAVVAVVLSINNWTPATIALWKPVEIEIKLPILVLIAFLAGFLPVMILHRTSRWRMRRRLESAERSLAELRPAPEPVVTPITAVAPPASIDPLA